MASLLPLLLSTAYLGDGPSRLLDQDFGQGLSPESLLLSRYYSPSIYYYRPWASLLRPEGSHNGGVSSVNLDKDSLKITLDVQQFKPEEVKVKIVKDYVVVEAKHEEKKDEHGLISRQFIRKYHLPEEVDADHLKSSISSDGVLIIEAPVKQIEEDKNVREIAIEYTGKPALKQASNEQQGTSATEGSSTTTTESSTTGGSTTSRK
ncbi:hypothetical protein QAD02_015482 [Eretmocerus hayati]|uniref:Uncharacterized protein n=1 Tax=Eretmocerus hayati TaxID=131215 RepID=A0ACC2PD48_9HYME|nr:hypothetical protein QAD02_015482 [Eretmocerus hayati]